MSTHNLYFEQSYENYQIFYLKNCSFFFCVCGGGGGGGGEGGGGWGQVKLSIYLNRRVFVMR